MGKLLEKRREETANRLKSLQQELGEAERICNDVACVYSTGSYARGESSTHSDLDLFIVARAELAQPGKPQQPRKSQLNGLDEILIKAELIAATRKLRIPDFSGEGEYLTHYM